MKSYCHDVSCADQNVEMSFQLSSQLWKCVTYEKISYSFSLQSILGAHLICMNDVAKCCFKSTDYFYWFQNDYNGNISFVLVQHIYCMRVDMYMYYELKNLACNVHLKSNKSSSWCSYTGDLLISFNKTQRQPPLQVRKQENTTQSKCYSQVISPHKKEGWLKWLRAVPWTVYYSVM